MIDWFDARIQKDETTGLYGFPRILEVYIKITPSSDEGLHSQRWINAKITFHPEGRIRIDVFDTGAQWSPSQRFQIDLWAERNEYGRMGVESDKMEYVHPRFLEDYENAIKEPIPQSRPWTLTKEDCVDSLYSVGMVTKKSTLLKAGKMGWSDKVRDQEPIMKVCFGSAGNTSLYLFVPNNNLFPGYRVSYPISFKDLFDVFTEWCQPAIPR